jgi:lysine-specific demethylase/histidyl-hydroxylase NO66
VADSALDRCVTVAVDEFASRYWGREPLLSRPGTGFADLFGLDAVDELLSGRGLRTPFLRMARDGVVLPASAFTGAGGAGAEIGDQVLDEKVLALLGDGATLVLQGLHRTWPPLARFATRLRADLGHPVQVNAYITPAGNRGFATHYDTHDVFVLQVAGRKRWTIHPPVMVDPLPLQPWGGRADEVSAAADGPPAIDAVFEPGDALYLPRGWLHSATAVGELSVHLTVGVRTVTRYALVEELLALAVREPELRSALPVGFDPAAPVEVQTQLTATVAALRDWLATVEPAEVAERMLQRSWKADRPAPLRPLAQAAFADRLDGGSLVMVRPGLHWRLEPAPAGRVVLRTFDRTLTMPAGCAEALSWLLSGDVRRVREVPGFELPDALVLVRRLLREAVLVPAVPPAPASAILVDLCRPGSPNRPRSPGNPLGYSERSRAMSLAWPSWDVPPGVSTITGTPCVIGCASSAANGSAPIVPAPTFSWRSRVEPHASLESLACSSHNRSGPAASARAASVAATPPGAARSCPAAHAWQVSRHTPSRGCRSTASRYGPRSSMRFARHCPPPALGSTIRRGASSSRPSRIGTSTSRTCRRARLRPVPSTALPAWNTTPRAPIPAARRSACRRVAADCSTVAGVGEPRFTSRQA